jgi:ATP-dependent helicase/nuclease subunit A
MAVAIPGFAVLEAAVEERSFTDEQLVAIERRDGDLLLDASAGSGKTSVLVERFARSVLEDGIDVGAILTITFTEKAAAEMRDRIRQRLRELDPRPPSDDAARAAIAAHPPGAFISTIHGFCARVLRAHALAAGLDPAFVVLDAPDAEQIADAAFDDALEELARQAPRAIDLIAGYGAGGLRTAITQIHGELRSRGERRPRLPALPAPPDLGPLRDELSRAGAAALGELGALNEAGAKVLQAIERLERLSEVIAVEDPWPGDLWGVALPGGNGAALSTDTCVRYTEALAAFRGAVEHRRAARAHELLDRLLALFGDRYASAKRELSGLDFEDLELECRELLRSDTALRERYRARFQRIMVDELQDTNRVQLELIELIASENLFTVGDAQQSIYGFRHADVELFERLGEQLAAVGARATLDINFRSRPEILSVINGVFEAELGDHFRPLRAGRTDAPVAEGPLVELLVADKGADWTMEGLGAPWRVAEARALAARVGRLLADGTAARDVVVLTRATTDLRVYERALEDRGVPTYLIGGRGYWAHPQVIDIAGYLAALANPRAEEALYTVLASPLVGVSADPLVVLAATARDRSLDPWSVLRDPDGAFDGLDPSDRARLAHFADWFAGERLAAARAGIEELIDRVLERTGYDLAVLRMPGGPRRLANVRKLMRLAREHEAAHGPDLRGFLDLVARRAGGAFGGGSGPGEARESEAPVEGEALDAVRLMTIHRAKGLEFDVVCVADLGRGPRWRAQLMRIGRDGRFGMRLAEPGTGRRESALDYKALGDERFEAEAQEERRLFYVAMTRARERLILSGAARLEAWPALEGNGGGGGPIAWIGPAIERLDDGEVEVTFVRPEDVPAAVPRVPAATSAPAADVAAAAAPPEVPAPPVAALSYSSLASYARCGYRFYAERVLRLPALAGEGARAGGVGERTGGVGERTGGVGERAGGVGERAGGLSALDRGTLVHALLERLDFRRPRRPTDAMIAEAAERSGLRTAPAADDAAQAAELVERFAAGDLCRRLGRATAVRREARFRFLLRGVLIGGVFDVIAREPGGRTLIVDYKTDRLDGADPQALADGSYGTQRLVYALAALRAGASEVEIVHTFLELPQRPAVATFTLDEVPILEERLAGLARGVLVRDFRVTDAPHRAVCEGCPAEGGLCSWSLEMTRREAPDRLF